MAGEGQGLDYLVVLGALYYERQDYGVFLGVGTHARDIVRNAVQGQAIFGCTLGLPYLVSPPYLRAYRGLESPLYTLDSAKKVRQGKASAACLRCLTFALPSGDMGEGKAKRKKRANARIVPTLTVDRRIRLTYRDGVRPLLRVSIGARRRGGSDHTRDGDLPGAIRKKRATH